MHHLIMPRAYRGKTALFLAGIALVGCSDITGPEGGSQPGRLVLDPRAVGAWMWLPNGEEILYSTRFDAPYTGPPTKLEVVGVSGEKRTVAAAPVNGDRIVPVRFEVQGSHVYFEMSYAPDKVALYRAPLSGASPPEMVLDSIPYGVAVSPDESKVAWLHRGQDPLSVITVDRVTGARRIYPLRAAHGDRIVWSPNSRSMVVEPAGTSMATGTPFQWLDLESGTVRLWLAREDQVTAESTRDFGWDGETPFLYTTSDGSFVRYSLATGTRETLASAEGSFLGWSADFESVVLATNRCVKWETSFYGEKRCIRWEGIVDRLAWRTGQKTNVVRLEAGPIGAGRLSPTGSWLAFGYSPCMGGCPADGIYVVPVR